jgi:hypothetical protein
MHREFVAQLVEDGFEGNAFGFQLTIDRLTAAVSRAAIRSIDASPVCRIGINRLSTRPQPTSTHFVIVAILE